MSRPDSLRRTPAYLFGRVHAYRDRGAGYVDGFRTSLQAGVLVSGVAFGATALGFFGGKAGEGRPAIVLGLAVTIGLELLKVVGGWVDHRWHIWQTQNLVVGLEVNPVARWQLELLEELVVQARGNRVEDREWIKGRRAELGLDGRRAERDAWASAHAAGLIAPPAVTEALVESLRVPLEKATDHRHVGPPPARVNPAPDWPRPGCV